MVRYVLMRKELTECTFTMTVATILRHEKYHLNVIIVHLLK